MASQYLRYQGAEKFVKADKVDSSRMLELQLPKLALFGLHLLPSSHEDRRTRSVLLRGSLAQTLPEAKAQRALENREMHPARTVYGMV
jgi:hypothetical protein